MDISKIEHGQPGHKVSRTGVALILGGQVCFVLLILLVAAVAFGWIS